MKRTSGVGRRYAVLIMCAAITVLSGMAIIRFSGQDSEQSNELSQKLALWVLSLLSVEDTQENREMMNLILRKLAHFGLYFLLGFGLTGGFTGKKGKVPVGLAVAMLGGIFAVTDEFHQHFSAGRSPCGWDVLLDICGAASGCLTFEFIRRLWKHFDTRKKKVAGEEDYGQTKLRDRDFGRQNNKYSGGR